VARYSSIPVGNGTLTKAGEKNSSLQPETECGGSTDRLCHSSAALASHSHSTVTVSALHYCNNTSYSLVFRHFLKKKKGFLKWRSSGMLRRVALVRTTSQKTAFFIVTAMKTSNLTEIVYVYESVITYTIRQVFFMFDAENFNLRT
jgi:hypothetical protein